MVAFNYAVHRYREATLADLEHVIDKYEGKQLSSATVDDEDSFTNNSDGKIQKKINQNYFEFCKKI